MIPLQVTTSSSGDGNHDSFSSTEDVAFPPSRNKASRASSSSSRLRIVKSLSEKTKKWAQTNLSFRLSSDDTLSLGSSHASTSHPRGSSGSNHSIRLSVVRRTKRRTDSSSSRAARKQVSFAPEKTVIHPEANDGAAAPPGDLFYTRKELGRMSDAARRLGEDVAWNQDKHVVTCLHYCHGFKSQQQQQQQDLSIDKALQYYFYYEASNDGETTTTLRGLERYLAPRILDHRMEYIQSVLALQADLRRKPEASALVAAALHKHSTSLSYKSKRFARLLGKGDAAILHNSSATSNEL